jgi:hypothetical protein
MKMLEWMRFFQTQEGEHAKRVFTVSELANVAGAAPRVLNVELSRLVKRGLVTRYAQGRYGQSADVRPEEILPFLDSSAYITGFYALYRHNLVMQVPAEITCFSKRRHNRSRERVSALGKFIFVRVSPKVYQRPDHGVIASPEQALCDFLYLTCRKSLRAENLVTFRGLSRLDKSRLKKILSHYPATVAEALRCVLKMPS